MNLQINRQKQNRTSDKHESIKYCTYGINKTKMNVLLINSVFFFHWDRFYFEKKKSQNRYFKKKDKIEVFFSKIRITWPKVTPGI